MRVRRNVVVLAMACVFFCYITPLLAASSDSKATDCPLHPVTHKAKARTVYTPVRQKEDNLPRIIINRDPAVFDNVCAGDTLVFNIYAANIERIMVDFDYSANPDDGLIQIQTIHPVKFQNSVEFTVPPDRYGKATITATGFSKFKDKPTVSKNKVTFNIRKRTTRTKKTTIGANQKSNKSDMKTDIPDAEASPEPDPAYANLLKEVPAKLKQGEKNAMVKKTNEAMKTDAYYRREALNKKAMNEIHNAHNKIDPFIRINKRYPNNSEIFSQKDPWGNGYKFRKFFELDEIQSVGFGYQVYSLGPDGVKSDDDVCFRGCDYEDALKERIRLNEKRLKIQAETYNKELSRLVNRQEHPASKHNLSKVKMDLQLITSLFYRYYHKHSKYPGAEQAKDFIVRSGRSIDPWGNPYQDQKLPGYKGTPFYIYSLGADGVKSADDIHVIPNQFLKREAQKHADGR